LGPVKSVYSGTGSAVHCFLKKTVNGAMVQRIFNRMADFPKALALVFPLSGLSIPASARTAVHDEVVDLFGRLRTPLLRYMLSMRLTVHDAEEIVQEVFVALFEHLNEGKPRTNLQAWVFRVAHNLALKHRVQIQKECVASRDDHADRSPGPEEHAASVQRQDRLMAVVRALPEQDRCCLSLRSEGLRYREIAAILGISLGSVANSLERSLARIARADECGRPNVAR
jgi:RNA polymerase sigma-70 factor (ECF subfamily)